MANVNLYGDEFGTMPNETKTTLAPPPAYNPNDVGAVQGYYQNYLGRAAGANDPTDWLSGKNGWGTDLASIENGIKSSGEAQAYAKSKGSAGAGMPNGIDPRLAALYQQYGKSPTGAGTGLTDWSYWQNNAVNNAGGDWNYVLDRLGKDLAGNGPDAGGGGQGGYGGTNVFSDPATAQFEQLLNGMIGRFNTSATPQHYQQTIDQLNKYLGQLNGPVYTPEQMNLMQTQAWDPMQQQHDTAVQQLTARMGAQGISPSSGIFQKAMEDLNRQFDQAHTQTQANFANNAIGLQRQNQAQAAALAPQISNFEQAQTGWQDSRALQAAQLAQIIPTMAQSRISGANNMVQGLNPLSLINALGSFQNQGYNQGAGYGAGITQLLATLFGLS